MIFDLLILFFEHNLQLFVPILSRFEGICTSLKASSVGIMNTAKSPDGKEHAIWSFRWVGLSSMRFHYVVRIGRLDPYSGQWTHIEPNWYILYNLRRTPFSRCVPLRNSSRWPKWMGGGSIGQYMSPWSSCCAYELTCMGNYYWKFRQSCGVFYRSPIGWITTGSKFWCHAPQRQTFKERLLELSVDVNLNACVGVPNFNSLFLDLSNRARLF